ATVALRGTPCSSKTLWDASGDAAVPAGMLRVWFADAASGRTPVRLFMETPDKNMVQVTAVDSLGGTVGGGVLMPAAPAGSDTVRLLVASELTSDPGTPGYAVPASVLVAGRRLVIISTPAAKGLALLFVGDHGPPPELPASDGDPAGLVNQNPIVSI